MDAIDLLNKSKLIVNSCNNLDICTATYCNQYDVVKDLLENNSNTDVDSLNYEGSSSLIIAVQNNFEVLARYLLFKNADPDIANNVRICKYIHMPDLVDYYY
jgi:ankyrin repeat protein